MVEYVLFHSKYKNFPISFIEQYLLKKFKFALKDPKNFDNIFICSTKEIYDYIYESRINKKTSFGMSSVCYVNIQPNEIMVNLICDSLNLIDAKKVIKWIYENYKNQITEITDELGYTWHNEIEEKGIDVLFEV